MENSNNSLLSLSDTTETAYLWTRLTFHSNSLYLYFCLKVIRSKLFLRVKSLPNTWRLVEFLWFNTSDTAGRAFDFSSNCNNAFDVQFNFSLREAFSGWEQYLRLERSQSQWFGNLIRMLQIRAEKICWLLPRKKLPTDYQRISWCDYGITDLTW